VSRIQEPHVYETVQAVTSLIGVTPLRVMRYPVGLYRSISERGREAKRERKRRRKPRQTPTLAVAEYAVRPVCTGVDAESQ
jgi:hypothetical protein